MTSLERTLVKAQIRRRRWFPRITVVTSLLALYFCRIDIAILVLASVTIVTWGLLSSSIDETEDIMRLKR
jgi:hypothetical protein